MSPALRPLLRYLSALTRRADLDELREVVASLDVGADDVRPHVRFSRTAYRRNLVAAGPWHQVLVLCWRNGQRSPIHDHAGSACVVRVLGGTLTETLFERPPGEPARPVLTRHFAPGDVFGSQDDDVHQVFNVQQGTADLVSLHVYSPPLLVMRTYSEVHRGHADEPALVYDGGAGI